MDVAPQPDDLGGGGSAATIRRRAQRAAAAARRAAAATADTGDLRSRLSAPPSRDTTDLRARLRSTAASSSAAAVADAGRSRRRDDRRLRRARGGRNRRRRPGSASGDNDEDDPGVRYLLPDEDVAASGSLDDLLVVELANLADSVTEFDLEDACASIGPLQRSPDILVGSGSGDHALADPAALSLSSSMPVDDAALAPATARTAFLTFRNLHDARDAAGQLHGAVLDGRALQARLLPLRTVVTNAALPQSSSSSVLATSAGLADHDDVPDGGGFGVFARLGRTIAPAPAAPASAIGSIFSRLGPAARTAPVVTVDDFGGPVAVLPPIHYPAGGLAESLPPTRQQQDWDAPPQAADADPFYAPPPSLDAAARAIVSYHDV
ncbi:hypothetical protein HK405_008547, partial [Cladochytrium tenue]